MPTLPRPNCDLYYEIWGESGPCITLVNGHTRTSSDFKNFGKYFVTRGWRALAFDNRAAGRSETSEPFTIEDMAGDVVALWQHLEVEKTALLGISMGGAITQTLAAYNSNYLSHLILISTAHDFKKVGPSVPWGDSMESVVNKLKTYFAPNFAARNALLIQSMAKQVLNNMAAGRFDKNADLQRQAMRSFDAEKLQGKINVPTLILHGREDSVVPLVAAEELRDKIAGSTLKVFDDVGHLLLAECADKVYQATYEFVSR